MKYASAKLETQNQKLRHMEPVVNGRRQTLICFKGLQAKNDGNRCCNEYTIHPRKTHITRVNLLPQ